MVDRAAGTLAEQREADPTDPGELKRRLNTFPFWAPRFWHGMRLGDWLRFLARNRFRIHPLRVPMAVIVTGVSCINTGLYWANQLVYGARIAATEIQEPPIFVLGHWRSGTTLLHELLVLDQRYGFPTTYECFAANHFVLTHRILPHLLWFLLPAKRPMDNMSVSFDHPQEDEFALVSMGAPTPILKMAFPNDPPPYLELLDMRDVPQPVLARWREALLQFVRAETYLKGKPLVLKSPPHTGRVAVLAEMFPGARFVHIVRDPRAMFPSNRRLWVALEAAQAFQFSHHRQLDEFIFSAFERMYEGFDRQRDQIEPNRICDVRYEDLVADPVGQMERIYESLNLGNFDAVRDKIDDYMGQRKDYRPNRHGLEPEIWRQIRQRWGGYLEKYGYLNGD